MSEELKRVRKGTKSCTECRRRKVRCTWSSDEAPRCRRCEERDSNCVAQVYSIQASGARRVTSRDRIARLEKQVETLNKALQSDGRGNDTTSSVVDAPMTEADVDADSNDDLTDTDSNTSDDFTRDPPAHLTTLFQNDLISSETTTQKAHENHRTKAITEISTVVRHKLQELIPPRQDVEIIAGFATKWLSLFHALFPAPSMIKTGEEMISQYEAIKKPSVDPTYLASWLLSIAMTIHQVPKGELGPEEQLKGFRNAAQFSKTVSEVVESTIMRHDGLLGTVSGIDAAMLYLRLQLSRGQFKKTWLQLRRVIAMAELIGLHRAARKCDGFTYPQPGSGGNVWSDVPENSIARKAQVWESLCSVDRIAGMMFNLPPGTRRYRMPQHTSIITNGTLSLRAYLCSLSEIAMKVQDLDDLEPQQNADTELYANVLKIDGELRVLASVTPASWWNKPEHLSDQLLQYWHFYITIRIHLPFTLRHDTSEQFSFSRLACMKACQTLLQRYNIMRRQLPPGFFLCRVVDLQNFTALVVLCLAYHAASQMERVNLHAQGLHPPEVLIPEALNAMRAVLNDPVADFARQAVSAVSALMQLLEGDNAKDVSSDLKLKVPLLGRIHIRRNRQSASSASPANGQIQSAVGSTHTNTTAMSSNGQSFPTDVNLFPANTVFTDGPQNQYAWDPLSWSIEDDQTGVFQNALMAEEFSPFGPWWDQSAVEIGQ